NKSLKNPGKPLSNIDKSYSHPKEKMTIRVIINKYLCMEQRMINSLTENGIKVIYHPLNYEDIIIDETTCILVQRHVSEEDMSITIYNASYLSHKYRQAFVFVIMTLSELKENNVLFSRFCAKLNHFSNKNHCHFIIKILIKPEQFGEYVFDAIKKTSTLSN